MFPVRQESAFSRPTSYPDCNDEQISYNLRRDWSIGRLSRCVNVHLRKIILLRNAMNGLCVHWTRPLGASAVRMVRPGLGYVSRLSVCPMLNPTFRRNVLPPGL